jgi:hypothetical protein
MQDHVSRLVGLEGFRVKSVIEFEKSVQKKLTFKYALLFWVVPKAN